MGLAALLSVLSARKLTVLFAVAIAGATAFLLGMALPKNYKSTARVQVDSLQENLLTGLFEPRIRISEFLGQQAAVASSRNVALQVYDNLVAEGVFLPELFEADWRERTGGEIVPGNDPRLWAADQLLRELEISADALESTLSITFRSDDPAQAAKIANAFASAYMDTILDQRQRRAARNAANFDEETRALALGIEDAQRDLTEFREESGIVGLGAQRLEDIEVELGALTMRLADARTDYSEAQSLLRQARQAGEDELLTVPLPAHMEAGQQAQARLGAVQVQVQRLAERYGPEYPPLVEARREKRALERTIMQAIEDNVEFAERRIASLEAAAKEKKDEVVALQETKQTYDVLARRVDASRQTYDLVSTRSLQESLQSRVDVIDVFMLARAVPPDRPATPPLPLIVAIGMIAGFFIGAGAAVSIELMEGRIRTGESIARVLRTGLVAEMSAPPEPTEAEAA